VTVLLQITNLSKSFGGVAALSQVNLSIEEGEIFSVIGPNGAGKTTLFNLITAIFPPTEGHITFGSDDLLQTPRYSRVFMPLGLRRRRTVHEVTRLGIARTFQNIRLFPEMTALENVMVGIDAHSQTTLAATLLATGSYRRELRETRTRALELLAFVGIRRYAGELSRNLAYGDQRRVEIARALGTAPRLLLLDEPAAGMNPAEEAVLMQLIQKVRGSGVTILLIEHDMKVVMGISDRIAVLDFGVKIGEGSAREVQNNPDVIKAYLGSGTSNLKARSSTAETISADELTRPLLEVENLHVNYGVIEAVKGVSLRVYSGEIVALIGSNGAGKSTILKTISGLYAPRRGTISFEGQPIQGSPPHRTVRLGIAHAPEGRRILSRMTLLENLQLAYREASKSRPGGSDEQDALARVYELFPVLKDRAREPGGSLSGGQQQMLAIGRALIAKPRLLMLDEPSMGLAPMMVDRIFEIIQSINQQGTTILLVEQNAQMALLVSARAYVLESGRIAVTDESAKLLGNDLVRRAYLGEALEGANDASA
jgi:branched-chain amino acid transport system ATP-binding protein